MEDSNVFTVTWKIDNINLYKADTDLSSPPFKIGRTKTTEFQIYLTSGDWSTKDICVRVIGSPLNLKGRLYLTDLSLLRADGGVIESKTIYWKHGEMLIRSPPPSLLSNENVFLLLLQPQNTLIVRWKVVNCIESGECSFRTVFQKKISRWSLHDFSKSTTFTKLFQLSSLCIRLDLSKLQHDIIQAKFIPSNQTRLHFGNCAIIAVDQKKSWDIVYQYGKVNVLCYTKIQVQTEDDLAVNILDGHHWEAIVMLNEGVCDLIKNDTLTLEWELTVGIGEIWDLESNALGSPDTLQSDLLRLYEDRKFCDVTLTCELQSFQVHKSVLCARSPVFLAMFDNDTEESRTGVVRIPDIEPDTVARMLQFLYTDSLGNGASWEMAAGLYYAADKYCIQALKNHCLRILKGGLSVTNACEALVLANTHQDEDLMQSVTEFISYSEDVLGSPQWKELEEKSPSLTVQFIREMNLKKKK